MSLTCTRCDNSGFLNAGQIPDGVFGQYQDSMDTGVVLGWMETLEGQESDVSICDCCGNMECWYGVPGEHNMDDLEERSCYEYNGGLPECW